MGHVPSPTGSARILPLVVAIATGYLCGTLRIPPRPATEPARMSRATLPSLPPSPSPARPPPTRRSRSSCSMPRSTPARATRCFGTPPWLSPTASSSWWTKDQKVGVIEVKPEPTVIDLKGAVVIPGLVDTHSHIGIYPKPAVPAHQDGNEMSGPVQGLGRALDAIDPNDPGIRMAVAGGVTAANIMPGSGNVIGGQTLYVKLRGQDHRGDADLRQAAGRRRGARRAEDGQRREPQVVQLRQGEAGRRSTRMKVAAAMQRGPSSSRRASTKTEVGRLPGEEGRPRAGARPGDGAAWWRCLELQEAHGPLPLSPRRRPAHRRAALRRSSTSRSCYSTPPRATASPTSSPRSKVPVSLTLVDSPGGKARNHGRP